jgi:hypothetical protein
MRQHHARPGPDRYLHLDRSPRVAALVAEPRDHAEQRQRRRNSVPKSDGQRRQRYLSPGRRRLHTPCRHIGYGRQCIRMRARPGIRWTHPRSRCWEVRRSSRWPRPRPALIPLCQGQVMPSTGPPARIPRSPTGPAHKCLVAVAYPDSEAPDPVCFHQAGGPGAADQHYAQLNIAIEPVPMHAKRPWMFTTFTINPDRAAVALARLRAEADIDPHPGVIEILLPALKATPGYWRVVRRPPRSFASQLPDFPDAVTRDRTQSSLPSRIMGVLRIKSGSNPSHEIDVKLHAGQIATINFSAVSSSTPGDAHIFHLTHTRSDGRVIGGLTLAAVVH